MGKELITIYFSECEHQGDLDNYIEDIENCNGHVSDYIFDHDNETAECIVEVIDESIFLSEFENTDSYGFFHLAL